MIRFWRVESTIEGKLLALLSEDVRKATTNDIASMGGRLAGPLLDFSKLIRLGLPGLRNEVEYGYQHALQEEGEAELYEGMLLALDVLVDVCLSYTSNVREITAASLDTYLTNGGTQAMITVVSRGDLEKAMKHPEQFFNLIVRVGGFSARFVELSREVQLNLANRTLY
jgi:autonomous glycyl radical cofactor GrcA